MILLIAAGVCMLLGIAALVGVLLLMRRPKGGAITLLVGAILITIAGVITVTTGAWPLGVPAVLLGATMPNGTEFEGTMDEFRERLAQTADQRDDDDA